MQSLEIPGAVPGKTSKKIILVWLRVQLSACSVASAQAGPGLVLPFSCERANTLTALAYALLQQEDSLSYHIAGHGTVTPLRDDTALGPDPRGPPLFRTSACCCRG